MSKKKISSPYDPKYENRLNETLKESWGTVEETLERLQDYIRKNILSNETKNLKFWNSELFASCFKILFDLCSGHDCIFYERELYKCYTTHIEKYLLKLLPSVEEKTGEDMIAYIIKLWTGFKGIYVRFCMKLLSYLDRYYVKNENLDSLQSIAYKNFRRKIYDRVSSKLNSMFMEKIQLDRTEGIVMYRSIIRDGIVMLKDMDNDAYENVFEKCVIEESKKYYALISEQWLRENSVVFYFKMAKEKIEKEENMLQATFNDLSQKKILDVVLYEILDHRKERLLSTEFVGLVKDRKYKELNLVYKLMNKIPDGVKPIAEILYKQILIIGNDVFHKHQEIVKDFEDHQKMINTLVRSYVNELIEIKENLYSLIHEPFEDDSECVKAFTRAFKEFVNKSFERKGSTLKVQISQIFAIFCDSIIRKNMSDLDSQLSKVIDFIQYFADKDLFISEYKKQLAKRLLSSQYREESEKSVISAIKYKYRGITDLYKLERMLSDKIGSRELRSQFKQFLKKENGLKMELDVTVLKQGAWPIVTRDPLTPPPQLLEAQKLFEKFYDERNANRKLFWSYENSFVQLQGLYKKGKKLFDISTIQCMILLLFNENEELSAQKIKETTGIHHQDLAFSLYSLSNKKYPILLYDKTKYGLKQKWYKDVETVYKINQEFRHAKSKIKIPLPRVTESSTRKTQESVYKDRGIAVDAAIVRIMKARRVLNLQKIITESVNQIHVFNPTVKQIKKRVEYLIESEYLRRSDDDHRVIEYIA